jgi:hypothetical protein
MACLIQQEKAEMKAALAASVKDAEREAAEDAELLAAIGISKEEADELMAAIAISEKAAEEIDNAISKEAAEEKKKETFCQEKYDPVGAAGGGESFFFHDGDWIIFTCPKCRRALSVHENDTNCRQFVCVGSKQHGTFANPHATQEECARLIESGEWIGCGCAFTLPADGSPPHLRTHG